MSKIKDGGPAFPGRGGISPTGMTCGTGSRPMPTKPTSNTTVNSALTLTVIRSGNVAARLPASLMPTPCLPLASPRHDTARTDNSAAVARALAARPSRANGRSRNPVGLTTAERGAGSPARPRMPTQKPGTAARKESRMTSTAWYFKALEMGKGNRLSREQQQALGVSENDPQPGYYRKRNKEGTDEPVAIWAGPQGMIALVGGHPADPFQIWTWVCSWPISEAVYRDVAENQMPWPGSDPIVAAQVASVGHNSGAVDEAEAFADQVDAAEKGKDAYSKITDEEQLAAAQSLRSRLLELAGEGEKKHKREKEPHLEAGRAVDKRWLPVVKRARAAADDIRSAMGAFETEKLRKQRDAEAARLAAEIAARKAEQAKNPEQPAAPVEPAPVAAAPTPIRGSYGRAASVSVVNVVTAITDQDALYRFLRDHPELKSCMFDLARRAVAKGHQVPGVTVEEQAKVA